MGSWGRRARGLPWDTGWWKLLHVGVTRRPGDLHQQELELGAGELPVTH